MRSCVGFLALAMSLIPAVSYSQNAGSQSAMAAGESSAHGTVYFYRYRQFVGSALSPSVYCDDSQLARIDNGRFFVAHVAPGKHSFRSNDAQSGIELDVKGGEEYFVRVEIAAGMMKGHGRLVLTPAEQGNYELKSKQLKPLGSDKITDRTRASAQEQTESAENKGAESK